MAVCNCGVQRGGQACGLWWPGGWLAPVADASGWEWPMPWQAGRGHCAHAAICSRALGAAGAPCGAPDCELSPVSSSRDTAPLGLKHLPLDCRWDRRRVIAKSSELCTVSLVIRVLVLMTCLCKISWKAELRGRLDRASCTGGWSQELGKTGGTGSKAASDMYSPVNLCWSWLGLQDLMIYPVLSLREKQNVDTFRDFNRIFWIQSFFLIFMLLESSNAAPLMFHSLVIVLMQAVAFAGGQKALQEDLISNESFL